MKNNADVGSKIAMEVANVNAARNTSSSSPQFHPTIVNTAADNRTTEHRFPVSDPHVQTPKYILMRHHFELGCGDLGSHFTKAALTGGFSLTSSFQLSLW